MAIQFQCPYCSATIKVPDSASGKVGQCPKCRERLQIPAVVPPLPSPEPPPPAAPPPDVVVQPPKGPLLGDKSTVFVLPPAGGGAAEAPFPPAASTPAAAAGVFSPQAAREEYDQGQSWLTKPFVRGAGWPAADRAVQHFQQAARLDPRNADYATRAGVACKVSITRFLESWGEGPLTSIAALHVAAPLGRQIDKALQLFRPSGLSTENRLLLVERANAGLAWFQQALEIDADDSVARCHRAELLRDVGAFSAALDDAKAVLSSPLVPSTTRDAAQKVADFILSEDSPLRKFLTRSEAQGLAAPEGLRLPTAAPAQSAAAKPPAPNLEDSLRRIVINTGESRPHIAPLGSLDPTQAEMPMFPSAPSPAAAAPSVSARLKRRQRGAWKAAIVPVLLGLILVGIGLGYAYINRVTFTGPLIGHDLGTQTLRHTYFRNEFGLPDDRMESLLAGFQDDPETLRTELRTMIIGSSSRGLEVSLRAGEKGRLVRVDLRSDSDLTAFCKEHAPKLQTPIEALKTDVLRQFGAALDSARSAGMRLGNLGDYINTLGGDLLVQGLGYHVAAVADGREYTCIYEDDAGMVYFLVPSALTTFEVIERKFGEQPSVFETEMRYLVTIEAPPQSAAPAATEPAPTPPTAEPEAAPASESPTEAAPAGETPGTTQAG